MLGDMPIGNGAVYHWEPDKKERFLRKLKNDTWFGFAEVDIEVPKDLWEKFEEMPPLFYNKEIDEVAIPKEMLEYLERTGRNRSEKTDWCFIS